MEFKRAAITNFFQRYSKKQWIAISAVFLLVFGGIFAFYLSTLFNQLDQAFRKENEFIPTRIYTDVVEIAPPLRRAQVLDRLKALGYIQQSIDANTTQITQHTLDYPADVLLPPAELELTRALENKPIRLVFDGTKANSTLIGIRRQNETEWEGIPKIYLEPELIATLSKNEPEAKREIRKLVRFDDIPAPIWQAILSIEDPRYMEHQGLDPRGIARAFWVNLKSLRLAQGGSTITAQLVKNLMSRRTRNVFLKFNELFLALILETRYSKEEILERYLNEVYLGQVGSYEVHGVSEGAKLFFGKTLDEMNLAETALMAGLIRGPGYYSPYRHKDRAVERQALVLKKMVEAGFIAEDEAAIATKQTVRLAPALAVSNKAPYFTDYVKAEMIRQLKDRITEQDLASAGFRVYTTLDPFIAPIAQKAIYEGVTSLEKKLKLDPAAHPEERLEGALATVDHRTGYIRALVGGKNYNESTFNRILNMKRQVGSTFKPLVYLTAFLQGEDPNGLAYGLGYPVEDAPWTLIYDHRRQKWTPRNYDKEFLGWIPLRTAMAKSINTVASRLANQVGIPSVIETARALGIESELPEVPSLALGTPELSPVELLSAYATIANHGVQDELTVIRAITQTDGSIYAKFIYSPKQVFPAPPVDLLIEGLKRTFIEGTAASASALGFDRPAAGKTGTTSSYRDAWFAGFTPHLTTVVWVGTDQNNVMVEKDRDEVTDPKTKKSKKRKVEITGASGALPIWVSFMKEALDGTVAEPFPVSENLTQIKIDKKSGHEAEHDCPESQVSEEWYQKDHEPGGGDTCNNDYPPSVRETEN